MQLLLEVKPGFSLSHRDQKILGFSVSPGPGFSFQILESWRVAGGEPVHLVQREEWTFLVLGQKPRRVPRPTARTTEPEESEKFSLLIWAFILKAAGAT